MSSIMRRRNGLISFIVIPCSKVGLKQPNLQIRSASRKSRAPSVSPVFNRETQQASVQYLAEEQLGPLMLRIVEEL
ncbi:hypothetical protein, partial [Sinorhizobium medicae]|uniref:hypothetical protein n=1 Tax=Sinorhizobium medicae TaxID=110321 RepID=UPI001FB55454